MDTPTITQYYRESDPARRLALLNMSIEAGEEPELNQIRRELWDIRYQDPSEPVSYTHLGDHQILRSDHR